MSVSFFSKPNEIEIIICGPGTPNDVSLTEAERRKAVYDESTPYSGILFRDKTGKVTKALTYLNKKNDVCIICKSLKETYLLLNFAE